MSEPTPQDLQEIQDLLKKMGLDPGQWGDSPERTVKLSAVERQREPLLKLRGLLEGVVEADRKTLLQLREQLNRLQFGGGS